MNRKLFTFYTILLLPMIFFSCVKQEEEYTPPEMVTEIVPKSDDNDYADDIYNSNSFNTDSDKPLIRLDTDEVLINTMNLNIDLDSQEEQILVYKQRAYPDGKIHIAVADYNNVQNSYQRVWDAETKAESIRSFMVHLDDLIGDHNSEIVCSGRDSEGRTTLDVFWKNTVEKNRLSYIPVFNISEKGTIEINQQERSRGYLQGLKNGASYTITITKEVESDTGSKNILMENYYWDFPFKKYILLTSDLIENTDVVEKQLEEILAGDEEAFYGFIEGPWVSGEQIIYFDHKNSNATFYTDDIQENYNWVNAYKVLSNLLYIRGSNEIINYIENEIYVRIIDLDQISITVRDINILTHTKGSNEIWTNKYMRMNNDMKSRTVKSLDSVIDDSKLPILSGQYVSGAGDIIEFYGSDFYMKNSIEEIKGGFAVYSADIDLLSLKIFNDKGIVAEERTFALDYTEEFKENQIERTIVITPGALSIYGFHPFDTEYFRLTQVETLEIPVEEAQ